MASHCFKDSDVKKLMEGNKVSKSVAEYEAELKISYTD